MTAPAKKLGELNGGWSALLKFALVTYPIVASAFGWWIWWATDELIVNREFRQRGDRFTQVDGAELELRIKRDIQTDLQRIQNETHADLLRIEKEIAALPPDDWRARILKVESTMDAVESNQSKIMAKLDTFTGQP